MKKTIILIIVSVLVFLGCSRQNSDSVESNKKNSYFIDNNQKVVAFDRDYVIQRKLHLEFDNVYNPSEKEIKEALSILDRCIVNSSNNQINDLSSYIKQVFGVFGYDGSRIMYIKNIEELDENIDWQNQSIVVDDGGLSYFIIKVNIDTGECFGFTPNGEA